MFYCEGFVLPLESWKPGPPPTTVILAGPDFQDIVVVGPGFQDTVVVGPGFPSVLLRLAVWTVMNTEFGNFLCWIALVCSSFSAVNVHTSGRSPATPWGYIDKAYVADSGLHFYFLFVGRT